MLDPGWAQGVDSEGCCLQLRNVQVPRPPETRCSGKEEAGVQGPKMEHSLWVCPASPWGPRQPAPPPVAGARCQGSGACLSPQAQSWYLQHDLGHASVFRKSWWNNLAQQFVMGQLKVREGCVLSIEGLSWGAPLGLPACRRPVVDGAWPRP